MSPAWSPGVLATAQRSCSRSVKRVNTGIGGKNENLNEYVQAENLIKKQTIYSNPNTKVNVTVKTKRSKHPSGDWSSILSDISDMHHPTYKKPMKKKPLPKKMATSKNLHSTAMKNKIPSKDEPDTTLKNQVDTYTQHKFTDRTLQIFLKEMRLAMKHENSDELSKILSDLEHIAANLNGPDERAVSSRNPEALIDVAFHKAEAKKAKEEAKNAKDDCLVLKRNYLKLEEKVKSLEKVIKPKDLEIKELNSVINRLKKNGNDMLGTLTSKVDIEDKLKTMERTLNATQQELAAEKFKNQQMDLKCKSAEFEINKLRKIVQDMKASGLQKFEKMLDNNFMQIETGPNEETLTNEDVTLDLSVSIDKSEKSEVSSHDDDPDSALGSALESQALANAPVVPEMSFKPAETSFKPLDPEMSFKPLDMSETKDSTGSSWAQSLLEESQHQQSQNMTGSSKAESIKSHSGGNFSGDKLGTNVAHVLDMLRNDERFQISLSSDIQKKRNNRTKDDTKVTLSLSGSDLDTGSVSESKFIEGLSRTLQDLATKSDDD